MTFLYPHALWLLLLVPLLAGIIILVWRNTGHAWRKLVSAQHQELVNQRPLWKTAVPAALALAALVCSILALARPINGYREGGATTTGRNILLALDISRSMETEDVKPSRLAEARAAAYELINALPGDKIGLIVFSGEADLVVPLTYDHTALRDALKQVNRNWAGVGGTNFGLVLRKAMQDFKRSTPKGSTNALVILSDGEDTVDSSLEVAEEARENKLLVITVGIGTAAGGPIPDARGENGLWQDAQGKHVISKLNTESLRRFAEATGGDFFIMNSNADLTAFTQSAVSKIDKHEEAFSINKVPNDLFSPFAIAALILLVLCILCSTDWKQSKTLALVLTLGIMTPHLQAAPLAESAEAYQQGLTSMRNQEQEKAREAFSLALLDEDPPLQAAAYYQLGQLNTAQTLQKLRELYGEAPAQEGLNTAEENAPQVTPEKLQEIVDSLKQDLTPYRDALKLQPSLNRAQKNITNIEKLIKKLEEEIERLKQQQQQQQNQQQDQQNQQQNQDKQQDSDQQEQKDDQQNQEADKENQDEQQKDSDQQQDQQDQQDQKNQDNKQEQNQQQEQNNDQQAQNNDQQEQKDDQEPQQNQDDKQPQQQQQQAPRPEEQEQPSDEEKARQYAASVLRSHMDEEQGSPIPHADMQVRPPDKDY